LITAAAGGAHESVAWLLCWVFALWCQWYTLISASFYVMCSIVGSVTLGGILKSSQTVQRTRTFHSIYVLCFFALSGW